MKTIKQNLWRRISQSEIRNSAAAESEGGQKFPACRQAGFPPTPFLFAKAISYVVPSTGIEPEGGRGQWNAPV
ncbi:MAG: hypothetical protein NTW60_00605 [Candidatus Wolfebacteria bacterium]|nr:hypothetical protein [Candidatus Wolfebacteria bacterium]